MLLIQTALQNDMIMKTLMLHRHTVMAVSLTLSLAAVVPWQVCNAAAHVMHVTLPGISHAISDA